MACASPRFSGIAGLQEEFATKAACRFLDESWHWFDSPLACPLGLALHFGLYREEVLAYEKRRHYRRLWSKKVEQKWWDRERSPNTSDDSAGEPLGFS